MAEHWPASASAVIFAGQETASDADPLTVTEKEQVAELLEVSVAVQVTVVTPVGKVEPDAGLHTTEADPAQVVAEGVV
jgi:hypothetical protein